MGIVHTYCVRITRWASFIHIVLGSQDGHHSPVVNAHGSSKSLSNILHLPIPPTYTLPVPPYSYHFPSQWAFRPPLLQMSTNTLTTNTFNTFEPNECTYMSVAQATPQAQCVPIRLLHRHNVYLSGYSTGTMCTYQATPQAQWVPIRLLHRHNVYLSGYSTGTMCTFFSSSSDS